MDTTALLETLTPFAVAVAALLGALTGSFVNVVAWRVPRGESINFPASHCPECDHPIRPWHNIPVISWLILRGRCHDCAEPISARYPVVEAFTSTAFAGTTLWLLSTQDLDWSLIPFGVVVLYFVAAGIALTLVDLDTHLLPNRIVLPLTMVALAGLGATAELRDNWVPMLGAVSGAGILFTFYFILAVARPGGMGFGDVKLAITIGAILGWFGLPTLAVGAFAAFLLGAVFGAILIATAGKNNRPKGVPFGPWMIAGAVIGVIAGQPIIGWYLGLFGLAG